MESDIPPELLAVVFSFVRGPRASGALGAARLACERWRAVIDAHVPFDKPAEPYATVHRWGYLSPPGVLFDIPDPEAFAVAVKQSGEEGDKQLYSWLQQLYGTYFNENEVAKTALDNRRTLIMVGKWDEVGLNVLSAFWESVQTVDTPWAIGLGVRMDREMRIDKMLNAKRASDFDTWSDDELHTLILSALTKARAGGADSKTPKFARLLPFLMKRPAVFLNDVAEAWLRLSLTETAGGSPLGVGPALVRQSGRVCLILERMALLHQVEMKIVGAEIVEFLGRLRRALMFQHGRSPVPSWYAMAQGDYVQILKHVVAMCGAAGEEWLNTADVAAEILECGKWLLPVGSFDWLFEHGFCQRMNAKDAQDLLAILFAATAVGERPRRRADTLELILPHLAPLLASSTMTFALLAANSGAFSDADRYNCVQLLVTNGFACDLDRVVGALVSREIELITKARESRSAATVEVPK